MTTFGKSGRMASVLAGVIILASCAETNSPGGAGFEARYANARTSLESRDYGAAIRQYKAMLGTAGPLESRLRLELAHAYLRSDQYADASREAAIVAAEHRDNRRAAALAVYGTAEHRIAQEAMSRGDFGAETIQHLTRARAALDEVLRYDADLDPLGAMEERRDMAEASLRNLGAY